MLFISLSTFIIWTAVLIVCGIFLVKSLSKIAKMLKISEFSAAFIIMALATSIPELFVGVSSALSGSPALSLGNVIGANIINLTLITGIIVLSAKNISFKSKKVGWGSEYMLFTIIVMIVLFVIGRSLSRIDGAVLLFLFFFHNYMIFKKRKKYTVKYKDGRTISWKRLMWLLIFIIAIIGLFISAGLVVNSAQSLAIDLKLSNILVGLFLLGFATALPELIFGISATRMKHNVMAIGDQIGTVIANTALVIGIVALIKPITAEFMPFVISSIFLFIAAFIFVTFLRTGHKLEKMEGISLILIYVLFIIIEFFVK